MRAAGQAPIDFDDLPVDRRIELGEAGPRALAYQLTRDHDTEVACFNAGQPRVLSEPVAVALDRTATAMTTHPSG